jgi:hypothetical protein
VIAIHLSSFRPLFNSLRYTGGPDSNPFGEADTDVETKSVTGGTDPKPESLQEAETGEETDSSDSSGTSGSGDQDLDFELSNCMKTCNKGNNLGSQGT